MSVTSSYHSDSPPFDSDIQFDSDSDSLSSGGASRFSPDEEDLPLRPTRSEYAAYAALLHNLGERERKPLARQLARIATTTSEPPSNNNRDTPALPLDHSPATSKHFSTRWPLIASDLPILPTTLDEAITSFATAYIRKAGLSLPGQELDGDIPHLPSNLVASTRRFVNKTLIGLAGLRPVVNTKYVSEMKAMGWDRVVAASSLEIDSEDIVPTASKRCREIFGKEDENEDLLAHRMKLVFQSRTGRAGQIPEKRAMYQPMIVTEEKPHQTEEELRRRAQKRLEREEKARLKALEKAKPRKRRRINNESEVATTNNDV